MYEPLPVGELTTGDASCVQGVVRETDATFDCTLNGEIDPWGVSETEVSFDWGRTTALGEKTVPVQIPDVKSEGEEEPMVKVVARSPVCGPTKLPTIIISSQLTTTGSPKKKNSPVLRRWRHSRPRWFHRG